jgi:hypothetical protein
MDQMLRRYCARRRRCRQEHGQRAARGLRNGLPHDGIVQARGAERDVGDRLARLEAIATARTGRRRSASMRRTRAPAAASVIA